MAITRLVARGASRHGILATGRAVTPSASSVAWRSLVANQSSSSGTAFTSQSFHTTLPRSFLNQTEETEEEFLTTPEQILNKCGALYESLTGLNDKLGGTAIPPPSDRATALPFCLLVGNHSSGKSSFINYVLGQSIQKSGVAPTDDTFTVIAPPGPAMPRIGDADGPTLVGNPDLGFQSLRQFGPALIHHTQLKVRQSPLNFMLVDSPGMIDAPTNFAANRDSKMMDRGYDFPGVIRWFAQRADVVLLFFDPDKPGTTGETMSVLLNSLSGMDHKLLIVLNKADQFNKIHDFARAYGSLCWNLSKVIPRKDLPPIFTMSLPNDSKNNTLSASLSDLEHTRDDVVQQVMQAPKRRIDNVITNLYDSTSMLILYSKIWNDVAMRYRKEWRNCRLQEVGLATTGMLALGGMNHFGLDAAYQGGVLGTSILGVGGLVWYHKYHLERLQDEMVSMTYLSASFQRTHARQVQDADEFVASLWSRVRESLQTALQRSFDDGGSLPTVSAQELQKLQNILNTEIPTLRRQASETK
jgi:GTPase SAR1 family protein